MHRDTLLIEVVQIKLNLGPESTNWTELIQIKAYKHFLSYREKVKLFTTWCCYLETFWKPLLCCWHLLIEALAPQGEKDYWTLFPWLPLADKCFVSSLIWFTVYFSHEPWITFICLHPQTTHCTPDSIPLHSWLSPCLIHVYMWSSRHVLAFNAICIFYLFSPANTCFLSSRPFSQNTLLSWLYVEPIFFFIGKKGHLIWMRKNN